MGRSEHDRIGPQRLLCGAIARVVPDAELPTQPGSAARTAHIRASLTPKGRHKGFENLGPEQAKWVMVGAVDGVPELLGHVLPPARERPSPGDLLTRKGKSAAGGDLAGAASGPGGDCVYEPAGERPAQRLYVRGGAGGGEGLRGGEGELANAGHRPIRVQAEFGGDLAFSGRRPHSQGVTTAARWMGAWSGIDIDSGVAPGRFR
jgi:hypothetical protein